jgi:NAD(P)-dependent dehydrogenase (short-subunit alcohol dehydrogenase family)
LQGLRALITGGDSGIGRAAVIAYLREGAQVAINYLPGEEVDAQDLADFVAEEGFTIERIPGDLTNETFCDFLPGEAARRLGGLDILVGNAGWAPPQFGPGALPITNHTTEQILRVFRTNIFANLFLVRAAVPLLSPGGSIIFTTSGMAHNPQPTEIDYGASKAALHHITSSLARQLIPLGIRVNAVQPGLTYSPFLAMMGISNELLQQAAESGQALTMTGRLEQPVELAGLFVGLADPVGTYTTGNAYSAGGGSIYS